MTNSEQTNGGTNKAVEIEVSDPARRRTFTTEYKRRIVEEVDAAAYGTAGMILRREGLYSKTVRTWRKQIKAGQEPIRGRRASAETPLKRQIEKLERDNERLKRKLAQAELIIDVQKKVAQIFGEPFQSDQQS